MGSLVEKLYQLNCKPTSTIQASDEVQEKRTESVASTTIGHLNKQK